MVSFIPKEIYASICDLTPQVLRRMGVKLLMMDFDNTIVPYTEDIPAPEVLDWLRSVQEAGVSLCVVSNTKRQRAPEFCRKYGIDCITHAKKPFPRGIREALRRYDADPCEAALVGDQIYTDILGANGCGVRSVLIQPLHLHNIWLRMRHWAELPWIAAGRRCACGSSGKNQ